MDGSDLEGRAALVTGASRGIGAAVAEALAALGVRLVLSASSKEPLERKAEAIRATGAQVAAADCDLSRPGEAARLAAEAIDRFGRLDFLINNAGTSVGKLCSETTDGEWERCLAVNATAPFILCRECLPALRKSDRGTIVNIASVTAHKGYVNQGAYTASKHALLGFTKVLAQEVQPLGVRVHAVCPGGVAGDMIREMRPDLDPESLIRPEEIADWIVFLLTRRGNAVADDLHLRRADGAPWY